MAAPFDSIPMENERRWRVVNIDGYRLLSLKRQAEEAVLHVSKETLMKKLFTILCVLCLAAILAVSASAATIPANNTYFINIEKRGNLNITDDGVISTSPKADEDTIFDSIETKDDWDFRCGYTFEVCDIEWDEAENTALVISVGSPVGGRTWFTAKKGVSLRVCKDGTVTFWNIGEANYYGEKNFYDDVLLDENPESFTYSLVPNADRTAWTVYLNDTVLMVYDDTNPKEWPKMFETMGTKRIGMGVFDGNDPENWCVPGSISFRVKSITTPEMCTVNDEVMAFGKAGDEVTVTAPAVEGKLFTSWGDDAQGITVSDPNATTLTFTMPEGGVKLTANYEDDPNYTPPTEAPTTEAPTQAPETNAPESTEESTEAVTTAPTTQNNQGADEDEKGGLHPAVIAAIAVAVVAVVVVIIVVAKKKK